MATNKLDLRPPELVVLFDKGKTFSPTYYYLDKDNGVIDLTGYTARSQARIDDVLQTGWDITTENGGITLVIGDAELEDGTIVQDAHGLQLLVDAVVTQDTLWNEANFDIEIIEPGGHVLPFLKGTLEAFEEQTKPEV